MRGARASSWPASRSSSQRSAVRRSCQTSAWCSGSPVFGSQTQTVSRWLVIPIACRSPSPDARVLERLERDGARDVPDLGGVVLDPAGLREVLLELAVGAARRAAPASSKTRQVVPVVPWSIARITSGTLPAPRARVSARFCRGPAGTGRMERSRPCPRLGGGCLAIKAPPCCSPPATELLAGGDASKVRRPGRATHRRSYKLAAPRLDSASRMPQLRRRRRRSRATQARTGSS